MRVWSKTVKHQSLSSRPSSIYNRILSIFLVFALVSSLFAGAISAADETVTKIEITTDTPSGELYVEDNTIILTATAITSSIDSPNKIITADAIWTSTSSSVKVDKGVVTATGAVSSATITAKYKDKSTSVNVSSKYYYSDLKLKTEIGEDKDKMDVELGKDLKFKAITTKIGEEDITDKATWTSSNSAVATVEDGEVELLTAGTVTITVKSKGKSDSIILTVTSPYLKINISNKDGDVYDSIVAPIEMPFGEDTELYALAELKSEVKPDENITDSATWTSSNAAVAKIDEKGKLTAIGVGTAIITVKRFGLSDSVTVIVRTDYEALKITPDKAIYVTVSGLGVKLTAMVYKGLVGDDKLNVEWKVSDEDQAVVVVETNPTTGTYAKPKGIGTAKITASYKGLSKDVSITVLPTISSVEISKEKQEAFVDDTAALPAVTGKTTTDSDLDIGKLVKWTSDKTDVVSIEDGKWKALKKGTATLTATAETAGGQPISDTFVITVDDKILALIPSTDTISVVIGKEVDFPAVQLIYENGEEEPISDKITWKSSTPNLLVKPTKLKGLLAATATLTGTYLGKTVKVKVTVEEEFTSFLIAPTKVSVTLNRSQTIKVTGTTKSGKKVTLGSRIDWKSSNEELVTVNGSSAKGLAEGSGKLTATVQGKSLEIPFVVTAKLTKLTASATSFKSAIGDQISIDVTALYENGKTASVASQAAWTTSKASVATVNDGRISVVGKGSASIKGLFGGKYVTIRISVK